MTDPSSIHLDRRRARSFGSAAQRYDAHRPHYPAALIAGLVAPTERALDVGAGTGIASVQLAEAGADVLAVEPDAAMAAVAAGKGVAVEIGTFESWEPRGRTFDAVVFAQSFHWVEPEAALAKVGTVLAPGGRLALLWNRIVPVTPDRDRLNDAYVGILDEWRRPSIDVEAADGLDPLLAARGMVGERRTVSEPLHYSTAEWIDLVTTYSNVLTLAPAEQHELRTRLADCIGHHGVDATNDALAVVCTRR